MSKAHTNRRKTIAAFKRKYGRQWHEKFRAKVDADVKARQGAPVCTLQQLMDGSVVESVMRSRCLYGSGVNWTPESLPE